MSLDGQVAIVTGASRGIGEYIAKDLAAAGATIVVAARTEEVSDPRLPGTIHSVAAAITEAGGAAVPIRTDMRDPESIAACVNQAIERFGRLDIVVNNAAVLPPGDLETVQERHLELIWGIDLRGPTLLCRYAVPHMRAGGRGHIINISSRAAEFPGPGPYDAPGSGNFFYGPVKAALERMSQRIAQDYQQANIACNVLSPMGRIRTPGNIFGEQDRENPTMEFEGAEDMGKAARWICEQDPQQYTGNIVYDEDLCRAHNL